MKLIVAYIASERLGEVKRTLRAAEGRKLSFSDTMGESCRGARRGRGKVRVEIAVNDECVGSAIKAIIAGARTGKASDGDISVTSLDRCIRIRNGEECLESIG